MLPMLLRAISSSFSPTVSSSSADAAVVSLPAGIYLRFIFLILKSSQTALQYFS